MIEVRTGADRLRRDPSLLRGPVDALGLVTNVTGTMPDLSRSIDALRAAGLSITALFAPEHGLWGSAQAGASETSGIDEASGLPVHDTYGVEGAALDALLRDSGVSALLVDLQDIGVRSYTYVWSLFDLMVSAARVGLPVTVLDRPNPLAGLGRRGPGLDPSCSSFVGRVSIPFLHALTLGELARLFAEQHVPARAGHELELRVITVHGWQRGAGAAGSIRPWVSPSPNLPTPASVLAYAGTVLFEGTNVSEGRGTTHPFELIGAPWADARFAASLRQTPLPGVLFRDVVFVPTFSKGAGERVRGVQLHITDERAFDPLATAVVMLGELARLYPGELRVLPAATPGERPFMDLLWGSDALRQSLGAAGAVGGGGDAGAGGVGAHPLDPAAALAALLEASPVAPEVPEAVRLY
ncbi:DUF1343 domain-containing protein [Microbacterium sp. STN6]|uniref:exo-beta-N-acetylmuramidase NamZ family protein n=1 Tax=Microbacterium sp. STN6 TaxID=2995588 RepID=UPI002260E809|nr:DUF1343 domain-containing protein [Microbacterium sp. STN6]MCX7523359.1 DUF1343 domain-containing protein [Microbacterium sp. STN6]